MELKKDIELDVQLFTENNHVNLFIEGCNSSGAVYNVNNIDEIGKFFVNYLKNYIL